MTRRTISVSNAGTVTFASRFAAAIAAVLTECTYANRRALELQLDLHRRSL